MSTKLLEMCSCSSCWLLLLHCLRPERTLFVSSYVRLKTVSLLLCNKWRLFVDAWFFFFLSCSCGEQHHLHSRLDLCHNTASVSARRPGLLCFNLQLENTFYFLVLFFTRGGVSGHLWLTSWNGMKRRYWDEQTYWNHRVFNNSTSNFNICIYIHICVYSYIKWKHTTLQCDYCNVTVTVNTIS